MPGLFLFLFLLGGKASAEKIAGGSGFAFCFGKELEQFRILVSVDLNVYGYHIIGFPSGFAGVICCHLIPPLGGGWVPCVCIIAWGYPYVKSFFNLFLKIFRRPFLALFYLHFIYGQIRPDCTASSPGTTAGPGAF
jgi:hypothetical protein